LLAAAAGLATAAVAALAATVPAAAQGSPGMVEHWGAFGTGGSRLDTQFSPVALDLPAPAVQVASSNSSQYALLSNGTVYAWGIGTNGELGDGLTVNSFTTPVQVQFPAGVTIAALPTDAMPYDTAFAVDTDGNVWGWGLNEDGELCLGNTTQYTTPVQLPLTGVTTLAGAAQHATYDASGTVYSCGNNKYGELGDGSTASSTTPVPVTALAGQTVTSLVASWGDTGALLSGGEYLDWGYDGSGQLGDGSLGQSSDVPVQVTLPGPVTSVAQGGSVAGNGQTLAILSGGSLYAWGNDSSYQLGDGRKASEASPEQIPEPTGVMYQALATGGATSYAIATTGEVYAWGASSAGQVGDGRKNVAEKPVKVEPGATMISATAADVVAGAG
jgi:alpha-tubulin suppressor-like RCC1 family protein